MNCFWYVLTKARTTELFYIYKVHLSEFKLHGHSQLMLVRSKFKFEGHLVNTPLLTFIVFECHCARACFVACTAVAVLHNRFFSVSSNLSRLTLINFASGLGV